MKKLSSLTHLFNLGWLGLLTYVVLPTFGKKGRRFSKRLNKKWFNSLAVIFQKVSETSADFMNYGFINSPDEEVNDIQDTPRNMYLHIATNGKKVDPANKHLLEVGCGKGIGGIFLTQEAKLGSYTGIDLSDEHIKIANSKLNKNGNIVFKQGDAEKLPIKDEKFDFVLNIESSHQYPKIINFYKEVKRVLKEDGKFMYVDFFDENEIEKCENEAKKAGLVLQEKNIITQNVCWALEKTNHIKVQKIEEKTPKQVQRFVKEWAGTTCSPLYKMLKEGKREYIYYVYTN